MAGELSVVSDPIVSVFVSSSLTAFSSERRFQRSLTIAALKGKLELLTGAMSPNMKLEAYNKDDKLICKLDDDEALLGSYPIDDGMRIHVIDKTGTMGQYEDVSKVEKQDMTEDDYAQRTDSVRAFKERNKMGRFNPEEQKKREEEKQRKEKEEKELAASMNVGDRCEVQTPGQPTKRGTVKYVGETDFKPGFWIGVQYDEPHGKNDGSVQGKRYFECQPKYGGFVKPQNVTVGDFPEEGMEDLMDDEDEM